jgi:osmotically-inducible protein OsmY
MAFGAAPKSDEELRTDVLAELRRDARLQLNGIGVILKDGVVKLTGWVDTYLKKWNAEEAAQRISGKNNLASEIEVRWLRAWAC